jgi:hypothetical protein
MPLFSIPGVTVSFVLIVPFLLSFDFATYTIIPEQYSVIFDEICLWINENILYIFFCNSLCSLNIAFESHSY